MTTQHPTALYRRALALALVTLTVVATACSGPLAPPPGPAPLRYRDDVFGSVMRTNDITYGSARNMSGQTVQLRLDLYTPPALDTVTARPAIVWVHGGSFAGGDKSAGELVDQANYYARKGYVNVSINYRTEPGGCEPSTPEDVCATAILEAAQDAQTAVRWMRANADRYDIDTDRIAIGGSSAGAITALNVGYASEMANPGDHQGFSQEVRAVQSLSGGLVGGVTVDAGDAPALLFHNTVDPLVPYARATETVNQAEAVGLVAVLRTWPGTGHVPYNEHRTQILEETRNFFYSQMDLAHAAR